MEELLYCLLLYSVGQYPEIAEIWLWYSISRFFRVRTFLMLIVVLALAINVVMNEIGIGINMNGTNGLIGGSD